MFAPVGQMRNAAVVFFSAAFASRLWLSTQLDANWALSVHGVVGDALAAVFLACLLALAGLVRRVAAVAVLFLWALLSIASTEHIYEFDAPLRLAEFSSVFGWDIVRSGALGIASWPAAAAVAVAAAYLARRGPVRLPLSLPVAIAIIAIAAASGYAAWRQSQLSMSWRHGSPLAAMVTHIPPRSESAVVAGSAPSDVESFFASETDNGTNTGLETSVAGRNVLLLVLAGLPGVYLEQVRQESGFRTPISMPNLSRIADRALVVPDFANQSSDTASGLYSLLCADYSIQVGNDSKAMQLRMLAAENLPRCLPKLLADAGYRTVFMRAAGSEIAGEKITMPRIGFSEYVGRGEGAEGIDDNFGDENDSALLGRTLAQIDLLRADGEPWFLTAVTNGTRQPFIAPASYLRKYGDIKTAAVRFLDDQLAEFMEALEKKGVAKDTLVVLVSDESHGVPGQIFGSQWGLALAFGPGVRPSVAGGVFGQIDIAVSVLDYLGLAGVGPVLLGRSIFRNYASRRHILFGEFALFGDSVIVCRYKQCIRYLLREGRLFASEYSVQGAAVDNGDKEVLQSALGRAALFSGSEAQNLLYSTQAILWNGVERKLLSGEFTLPEKSRIEIFLDIENTGSDAAVSAMMHLLNLDDVTKRATDSLPQVRLPPMPPGSRLVIRYSFVNIHRQQFRLLFLATGRGGELIDVMVNNLRLFAVPADSQEAALTFEKFELHYPHGMERSNSGKTFARVEQLVASDNLRALSGISGGGDYLIVPQYRLGKRIDFADIDDWTPLLFLARDWSYPDSWGVWSDGDRPSIAFKLASMGAVNNYELEIELIPHLEKPVLSRREFSVRLNGRELGNYIYYNQQIEKLSVKIPAEILVENGINTLEFPVKHPFVPYKYNVGKDYTRLGFALVAFQIKPIGGEGNID